MHARHEGRERRGARVERRLVARPDLGDEVFERRLDARLALAELPGVRGLQLLGEATVRLGVGAEEVLVVAARDGELDALAVGLVGAARRAARRGPALAVGGLGRDLVRARRGVAQREQRLFTLIVRRRELGLLVRRHRRRRLAGGRLLVGELANLLFLAAHLLVLHVGRRRRGHVLSLAVLLEVRLLGARLLGDAVVLLGEELGVRRRRNVLVVLDVDHLHVVVPLGRRRPRRLGHGRHRRRDDLGLGLRRVLLREGHLLGLLLGRLLRVGLELLEDVLVLIGRLEGRQAGGQLLLGDALEPDVDLLGPLRLFARGPHEREHAERRQRGRVEEQGEQRSAAEVTAPAVRRGWGGRHRETPKPSTHDRGRPYI